jgi:hypothetical protein
MEKVFGKARERRYGPGSARNAWRSLHLAVFSLSLAIVASRCATGEFSLSQWLFH